jgi:hypothetical protein
MDHDGGLRPHLTEVSTARDALNTAEAAYRRITGETRALETSDSGVTSQVAIV